MLRLLPALTVIATLAVAPVAFAQSAIAPEPVAPSAGKSLARGKVFTFKARLDEASEASGVFLKVSKSKRVGSDGTLANSIYFRAMKGLRERVRQEGRALPGALVALPEPPRALLLAGLLDRLLRRDRRLQHRELDPNVPDPVTRTRGTRFIHPG